MTEPVYKYSYVTEATIKIVPGSMINIGDVILIGRQRAQVMAINRASAGQHMYVEIFGEAPDNGSRKKWMPRFENYYLIKSAVYRDMSVMPDDIDDGGNK